MAYKLSFKLILSLISCFLCFFFLHVDSNLQTEEVALLLNLKHYWQDPPSLSHWNNTSNNTHCSWPELTCIGGSVTALKLRYYELSGTIPPFICDLKNITSLDLSSNYLHGEFPKALYNCSKLTHLNLSFNSFAGEFPRAFSICSKLTYLDLSFNSFSGEFSTALHNCTKLTYLNLGLNSFQVEFPRAFSINLGNNEFFSLIPTTIGQLESLRILDLSNNMLTGNLPDSVFALKNLMYLNLQSNNFSGEIPEVTAAFNLTAIDLSSNKFEGKIPQGFGKLLNLSFLSLSMNQLSGEIPNSIAHLPALESILLYENNFSGTLPPALGQYSPLREFQVFSNRFTGELPKNLCAKGNLVTLDASDNNFSGEPFESLSNCFSLLTLRIDSNLFSGRIPADISWRIKEFSARNNQISGPIPERIAPPFFYPIILDLSENQLSGLIPDQLGDAYFSFLNLSSNHLIGSVPYNLEKYSDSFLNNPGLLYPNNNENPKVVNHGLSSSRFSSKVVISIVSASVVAACLGALFFYILLEKLHRAKKVQNKATDLTWKFITFHVLSFGASNILSGITEGNEVGHGGSGKVYRVSLGDTEGFVAVKKICSNRKVDKNLEKQFLAEVDILGKIRHLNIVKLLCCISSESSKLLVYEYMENRSLDWWLHRKNCGSSIPGSGDSSVSLAWPMRLKIAIGAAQGLCYMHNNCSPPIIHRDVKSANILLDDEFNAKVADFGLAKLVMTAEEANAASVVAGSFGYIAPEYAQTKRLNEKIDVYSFGVVLLELTTGKKANAGDEYTGLAQWAWRHMQEGNHIPDALDEDIRNSPDHVDEMVNMFKLGIICTRRIPSARPSMKEVLQILQSFHLQIEVLP